MRARLLVGIWDKKAQDYISQKFLYIHSHVATAQRMFADALADEASGLARHADDYELHHVGWILENGTIAPMEDNKSVILMTGKMQVEAQAAADARAEAPIAHIGNHSNR